MSSGWIDRGDATRVLQQQAAATATNLGHRLGAWMRGQHPEVTFARCEDCGDLATVRPRSFRAATISGAAVGLRCRGAGATSGEGARGWRSAVPCRRA